MIFRYAARVARPRSMKASLAMTLTVLIAGFGCGRSGASAPAATGGGVAIPVQAPADAAPPVTAAPPATAGDPATRLPKPAVAVSYAEAGGLHYLERFVGGAQPAATLPMIVAIHGLGDRPEAFAAVLENFPEPARVILPRGLEEFEGGWSWFSTRARDPDVEALSQQLGHAADVIAEGLRALTAEKPTLGKPIVTGFSQGGMLSFALAIRHPELVSTALPIGGWLPPPLWPQHGPTEGQPFPKIVALHGTADNAVLYAPTSAAVDHLQSLGYDARLTRFEGVPHAMPAEVRRALADELSDACDALAKQRPSAARLELP